MTVTPPSSKTRASTWSCGGMANEADICILGDLRLGRGKRQLNISSTCLRIYGILPILDNILRMSHRPLITEPPERLERTLVLWGPSARLIGRLGGGNRGEVWEVRVGSARYAARLSGRSREALEWEFRLLDRLRSAGMLVPDLLPTADGRRHAEGLVLYGWLEGDPPERGRDWRLVVQELRRLHRLTRGWPQRPGFHSTRELLTEDAGGDVHLDLMPPDAVACIRSAWRAIVSEPTSVIHGDPGAANIRIRGGRVGFLDWDEARVDASVLDLASVPLDLSDVLDTERLERVRHAADAWEAANGWVVEPEYARVRLSRLQSA